MDVFSLCFELSFRNIFFFQTDTFSNPLYLIDKICLNKSFKGANELLADIRNITFFQCLLSLNKNLIRGHEILFLYKVGIPGPFLDDSEQSVHAYWLLVVVHEHWIKSIIAISELDDVLGAHPYSLVILD